MAPATTSNDSVNNDKLEKGPRDKVRFSLKRPKVPIDIWVSANILSQVSYACHWDTKTERELTNANVLHVATPCFTNTVDFVMQVMQGAHVSFKNFKAVALTKKRSSDSIDVRTCGVFHSRSAYYGIVCTGSVDQGMRVFVCWHVCMCR